MPPVSGRNADAGRFEHDVESDNRANGELGGDGRARIERIGKEISVRDNYQRKRSVFRLPISNGPPVIYTNDSDGR